MGTDREPTPHPTRQLPQRTQALGREAVTRPAAPGVPEPLPEAAEPSSYGRIEGKVLDGKYRVEQEIGRGGMAKVYQALHLGLKQRVAVKILHERMLENDTAAVRFEREAYSASRLRHPNCLQVTDFGATADGMKYMVMELLRGHDLSKYVGEPVPVNRATSLMLQILRGLQHAHESGLVHRDLKPQNIFVTTDHDGREVLKIVDFGLAKILTSNTVDPAFTQYGMIFGTPLYMSPEQAVGLMDVDARSDLYSAGVIFYHLLTGHPPFKAEQPIALLHQHVAAPVPPLPKHVPKRVRRVVETLLAKHRDHRFGSAREVLDALRPRPGQKPPPLPDPQQRAKQLSPRTDTSKDLAKALRRVAMDPSTLRVDGTDSVTPMPVMVGEPELPSGPQIELASVRRPDQTRYVAPRRSSAPLAAFALVLLAGSVWALREFWAPAPMRPFEVALAGFTAREVHISMVIWALTATLGIWAAVRAKPA